MTTARLLQAASVLCLMLLGVAGDSASASAPRLVLQITVDGLRADLLDRYAASFGKAWDTWRDAMSDPDSVAAKLQARLTQCDVNLARRGYDLY